MPRFLGIGAMRAGTSWLAENLRRHPRIWIGRKEVHFFDRKLDARWIPLLDPDREARLRYAVRFLPGTLRNMVTGEFTPRYALLEPAVIARIRAWMPEVKLLFILREPVERAWSQACHDHRAQGRFPADFTASELTEYFNSPGVKPRGHYAACLRNWLSVFDREQIMVSFLEEARRNPIAVLRDAFTFLGVESSPAIEAGMVLSPVHTSKSSPMPEPIRRQLTDMFGGERDELEALIGRPVPWT